MNIYNSKTNCFLSICHFAACVHISVQWQYYYVRSYSITPTSVSSEARARWWNVMDEEKNSKWHQDLFSQHSESVCETRAGFAFATQSELNAAA